MDSYSGSIFQWRLGTESQYVSIYWCPTELHRVVRPLFRLKWPPKVRLLLGLKGHGGPRVSLLFKVSTLSHRHGGQKAHWAFMHMTRPIKEHHPSPLLHIFPLKCFWMLQKERRANCLLWEPKLQRFPSISLQLCSFIPWKEINEHGTESKSISFGYVAFGRIMVNSLVSQMFSNKCYYVWEPVFQHCQVFDLLVFGITQMNY